MTEAQFWDPAFGPFPDPKNAVFAFLAEKMGMKLELIPAPARTWMRSQVDSKLTRAEATGDILVQIAELNKLSQNYERIIVGIGSGVDLEEQGLLAEQLWQDQKTLYLFLEKATFSLLILKTLCFLTYSYF